MSSGCSEGSSELYLPHPDVRSTSQSGPTWGYGTGVPARILNLGQAGSIPVTSTRFKAGRPGVSSNHLGPVFEKPAPLGKGYTDQRLKAIKLL